MLKFNLVRVYSRLFSSTFNIPVNNLYFIVELVINNKICFQPCTAWEDLNVNFNNGCGGHNVLINTYKLLVSPVLNFKSKFKSSLDKSFRVVTDVDECENRKM